jgi:hypothetical protein
LFEYRIEKGLLDFFHWLLLMTKLMND